MPPKRKYTWQTSYAATFGLKVTSRSETNGAVDAAVCCFCQTFGREGADDPSRKRSKTKNHQFFTKDKFNPSNIKKHMQQQHPERWKQYIEVRDNKASNPEAFSSFFEQTMLQAFWYKKADVDGKLHYNIEKDIIEVIIRDMLFDEQEKDGDENGSGLLPGDLAMKAFKHVKNEAGEVVSYMVTIENKAQFDHVCELVSACLSFRQVAKVVKSDRENLKAAARISSVSSGQVATLARIACAIGLQTLSEIMQDSWAFSIGADESNNDGDSHLDCRVRFPPIVGFEASEELSNGFHLLAIPLFARAHTGREYADSLIKVLDVLCQDWRFRLMGSSTDGAGNMAGHNGGFSTLLKNESECCDAFYRIWCLAHQLDLVIKDAVNRIEESGVFPFVSKLTEIIGYLRRQTRLIQDMDAKCPYFIQVRWKSLAKVLKWLAAKQTRVSAYMQEKGYASAPSIVWWLIAKVCLKFLNNVMITFDAFQKSYAHLYRQIENLDRLSDELRQNCGATIDESITEPSIVPHVVDASIKMGPFTVTASSLKSSVVALGVAAMDEFEALNQSDQSCVLRATAVVYLSTLNGIMAIKAERNCYNQEFESLPPYTPLELVK